MPVVGFIHNHKRVRIPIYHGYFDIVISSDFNKSAELMKFKHDDNLSGFGALAWDEPLINGFTRYAMFLEKDTKPNIIAHEAVHIARFIFDARWINLDLKHDDEAFAYLVGWIVNQVDKYARYFRSV